ncbi:hypothetical protein I4U23_000247 [Adineta vaga]|nr:hypothetical protein I4U23_000247 [Adineta vaga]
MILPSSSSSTCYSQLISLSINDCELSMQNFEILFSLTPSLNYLKIISTCRPMFDNVFYGSSWEKFIRVKLHQLKQFEFLFCYYLRNCDTNDEVTDCPILISEFQSPFWLNEKHWFVTSDFSLIILSLGDNQINTVMIVHIAGLLRRNKQLLCSKI